MTLSSILSIAIAIAVAVAVAVAVAFTVAVAVAVAVAFAFTVAIAFAARYDTIYYTLYPMYSGVALLNSGDLRCYNASSKTCVERKPKRSSLASTYYKISVSFKFCKLSNGDKLKITVCVPCHSPPNILKNIQTCARRKAVNSKKELG